MSKHVYDNHPCRDTDMQLSNTCVDNIKINIKRADKSTHAWQADKSTHAWKSMLHNKQ
jgi:hypothetical protein